MKQSVLAALIVMWGMPAYAATCMTEDPFPFTTQYAINHCPDDIQNWLNRVNTCAHFAGEELYDAERKAYIDAAVTENVCHDLGCDMDALFLKYEGDIAYTGVLFEYGRVVYGSEDAMPQCSR